MREVKDLRLFFALWPDEGVRKSIDNYLASLPSSSGRVVPRYNWHMTLHFVGNTTFAEKTCLDNQAANIQATQFQLTLDQTGYFKKPKVYWLGCSRPPEALFDLQRNLGEEICRCEYQPETRPYTPHVTIARKIQHAPDIKPPGSIVWDVDRFVLIESVSQPGGVRYKVIEEYLLG